MKTTYRTTWGSDVIEIRADFAQASCPVEGTNGRQVADFRHRPSEAMRYAVETEARAEGLDLEADEVQGMIEAAVIYMDEIEECPGCGRVLTAENMTDQHAHNTGGERICLNCHRDIIESDPDLECPTCRP